MDGFEASLLKWHKLIRPSTVICNVARKKCNDIQLRHLPSATQSEEQRFLLSIPSRSAGPQDTCHDMTTQRPIMKRISMRAAVPVLLILQEVSCFSTQPAGSTFTCRSNGSNGRNNAPLLLRMSDQTTVERSTTTTKVSANEISQDLPADLYQQEQQLQRPAASSATDTVASATTANFDSGKEYRRGLATIGLITLVFASMSPVMHAALATPAEGGGTAAMAPPVLLLNAAVSVIALLGLVVGGPVLQANTELPISLQLNQERLERTKSDDGLDVAARAGLELGLWKFLGTTANLFGLALTTSAHGAFLVQLTTLIVPVAQGIMGVPIPKRIAFSIGLALIGGGVVYARWNIRRCCRQRQHCAGRRTVRGGRLFLRNL